MPKKLKPLTGKQISVEEFLDPFPASTQKTVQSLRAIIGKCFPDVIERVYPGWKLIGYRVVHEKESYYFCYIAPLKDRVELGFEYGKLLSDPEHVLEGSGSQVRKLIIHKPSGVKRRAVQQLIFEGAMIAIERKQWKK